MKKAAISIIMPVYNSEKYIVKSVESVLAQTFTDFELLLVACVGLKNAPSIYQRKIDNIGRLLPLAVSPLLYILLISNC